MSDDPQGLTLDEVIGGGSPPAPAPDPTPQPQPSPKPQPLSLDEVLSADQDSDRFKAATAAGLEQDPARASKLISLQAKTGLPTELIDRNLAQVEAATRQAGFDPDAFRRQSPVVAQWLSEDPARVGLTRDDLPHLAAAEALIRSSPDYRYRSDGSIVETFPGEGLATVYANARDLQRSLVDRGLAQDEAAYRVDQAKKGLTDTFGPLANVAAGAAASFARDLQAMHAIAGSDSSDITTGAQDVAQASQQLSPGFFGDVQRFAGGLGADLPLLAAGGVGVKAVQGVGRAVELAGLTQRLLGPEAAAKIGAAATSGITANAVAMQPFALRDALADEHGAGHALGSWAIDSAIPGAFGAFGGPVGIGRAAARAAGATLGPAEAEISAAGFVLKEAGLNAGQNAVLDLAHRMHDTATGVDPTALDLANLLPSLAKSGLFGAAPAALFSLPEAAEIAGRIHERAGQQQINASIAALHASETIRAAHEEMASTDAMALNQDAMQSLLQRLAGDTPYRTLYVDAQAWAEHFSQPQPLTEAGQQTQPGSDRPSARSQADAKTIAMDATGDPMAFDKALSAGGQLAVPFERFLPLLNDATHRDWLLEEARTAPEAMNAREVKAAAQVAGDEAAAQAKVAGPGSPEADRAASADLVYEDVKRQLLDAKVPGGESAAEQSAQLWRSIFHTASARGWTNLQPHELYQQSKVRIQRVLGGPAVKDALDAMIARLKAGDIPSEGDIQRAMVMPEGQQERQPTEDSARIQQTRDRLLATLQHLKDLGANVSTETPDQLKARILGAQADAAEPDRGEAFEQQATGHVANGHPIVLADVPYAGGTSEDGRTVYIDRRVPRFHDFTKADGSTVRLDLHQMIAEHEIAEKTRMDRGESYSRAHDQATAIEHDEVDHQGISHADYEAVLKPYIDQAKREAKSGAIPADLEPKPYRDMGEEHLIQGRSGGALEQPGDQAPRGTFLPKRLSAQGENLIRLMKGADRSSFLHESAHFLLEMLHEMAAGENAPEALKADLAGIRSWLGVKDGEAVSREQHETFARGFERFLMEGKAPSIALRGAFERFKRWMVNIYRDVTSLRVNLSPEVREIFQRILASDDEIAAARAESGADVSLFQDQAESGMNDDQWRAYQERIAKGHEVARQILERDVMAPLVEEEKAQYQRERAAVREQVANEVNQQPAYTALLVLQKGAWPEGIEVPEGSERVKLDRADLVDRYGEAALKLLPGPKEGGKERPNSGRRLYAEEGGIGLDEAAQIFGFKNGGDLWDALVNAPDRTAAIERATDERMQAAGKVADPLLDGSLPERARVAVANDPRLGVMEREAEALALKAKRPATPSDLLKAIAKAQVEKTLARDLRPSLYRVAMNRESRETVRAQVEARHATDPAEQSRLAGEALRHKQNEILQTHLFRESAKAVERSEKGHEYLATWDDLAKRQRIGKAGGWEWLVTLPKGQQGPPEAFTAAAHGDDPEAAQRAAIDRASAIPGADIVRTGYLEQADAIREGLNLKRVSNAQLQKREALSEFIARKEADGDPIQIDPELVADLGKKNWRDLTIDQQSEAVDALKNLEKLAGLKNKLLAGDRRETFTEARDANIAAMEANSAGFKPAKTTGRTPLDLPKDIVGRWFSSMATVSRLVREMDGLKDGGVMFETWLRPVNEAEAREQEFKEANTERMAEMVKEWGKLKPGSFALSFPKHEPAIGASISHWERLMVALNWGNADNRARLMQGHGWTEAQVQAVMAGLDRSDMRFVQGILDHINSYWPEIKAKQERVTGVAPEKVDAVPIIHATGIYDGGYFPISYDPKSMPKGRDVISDEAANLQRMGARLFATTKRGHTQARTGMADGAFLNLDPSVITRHLDAVAHDLAYHETMIDLNRLLRDKDLRATMLGHWGVDAYRQFQTRLSDIAAGAQTSQTGIERLLEWTRQGVNFANRALNIGSALQQVAGLPQSLVRVGPRHFATALFKMFRSPFGADGAFKWVDEQSTMMRNRSKTFDKNVNDAMGGITLRGPIRKTIDAVGYYFWTKAFQVLDTHTWLASYSKAMEDFGGDHDKARAIADQTVTDIQGSGATKDLPAVMRGGALAQVFTSNMSWWLANYNLSVESGKRITRGVRTGNVADVLKGGADLFVLYGVQVAAWSAVSAALTGKGAKAWQNAIDQPGDLAKSLAKDAAYTGLSSIVLLRDLTDVALEGRDYRGPQGLRSMSIFGQAIKAVRDDNQDQREAEAISRAAGVIFHVPVAQLVDSAEGLVDAQKTGANPLWPTLFGKRRE